MDVYGLVGHPVEHSLSPPMHEAAYDALGLDARYVTFDVVPGDLPAAVEGARALGVAGLNVTVPHKERVLELVEPDPLAARIGAVNTVAFADADVDADGTDPDGDAAETGSGSGADAGAESERAGAGRGGDAGRRRPTGHNTDALGARRALRAGGARLAGATAVVVGAGGAGRAVTVGLLDAGARVRVANRTVERAERLVADLRATPTGDATHGATTSTGVDRAPVGSEPATDPDPEPPADDDGDGGESEPEPPDPPVSAHPLEALPALLGDATVLVNATTVGMEEARSPVPAGALHADLTVLDAVYRPLQTRLLRAAADSGATTVDGGRMLLHQGAAAFERWTGREPPVEAMETALYDRL